MTNATSTDFHHFFTFSDQDLVDHTPVLKGFEAVAYISGICIVSVLIVLVQKAVNSTFKKLGNRYINILIQPYLLTLNCLTPTYLLLMISRSLYYPVKAMTGPYFCYYVAYSEVFTIFLAQFQTFFLTLYRYICLFYDDILVDNNLHPRTLAKMTAFTHFFTASITSFSIVFGSEPTFTEQACLGNYAELYQRNGQVLCSEGSVYSILACKVSFIHYLILSSNLPEAYFLYQCFKKIEEQTESVQWILDKVTYRRRRRDNGIVIRISIIQWFLEMGHLIFYFIYVMYILGWNLLADKFFNLYLVAFHMVLQPAFYVTGDSQFRAALASRGFAHAIKAVFKK